MKAAWGLKSRSLVVPNSKVWRVRGSEFEFFVEELGAFSPVDGFGETSTIGESVTMVRSYFLSLGFASV